VSLRGPPCAFGVSGIPYGEVRDRAQVILVWVKAKALRMIPNHEGKAISIGLLMPPKF